MEIKSPYKGLQPYEEENRDFFFGRESEKAILVDKIFSNKLTLLFAASGVGKSSLLQASVMPELKRPDKENLDVVCFNDWVAEPLADIKTAALDVLRERGKVAPDFNPDDGLPLSEFFLVCATFASEPLVVILDQFEEFFQYQRYKPGYRQIIRELAAAFNDMETPVVFVISMREDFAMELNSFKEHLPTTLFENYFRLERLAVEKARTAIEKPVQMVGYAFEPELLETLLKDLADREKEGRLGASAAKLLSDAPEYVEPPYLQIVCTHLWDIDKDSPDRMLHKTSYDERGKARGFVDSYFRHVMSGFSQTEKRSASKAFNHLVTPHGTKMAYTVNDLAELLRVDADNLEDVLGLLEIARVLRRKKRENVTWFELYHDIFSNIIYDWNEKFKAGLRRKKGAILSVVMLVSLAALFCAYNFVSNYINHHFRMDFKSGTSAAIELHHGKARGTDFFNIRKYQTETNYRRDQVEPDKLFENRQVGDFEKVNKELIEHLPLTDEISEYWKSGMLKDALELGEISISSNDMVRTRKIINLIAISRTNEGLRMLSDYSKNNEKNIIIRRKIISIFGKARLVSTISTLNNLLKDKKDKLSSIRTESAYALSLIGRTESIYPLIAALDDKDPHVRKSAAYALGRIGSAESISPLISAMNDHVWYVRIGAVKALGRIGSAKSIQPLIVALNDHDTDVRLAAAEGLGRIGSTESIQPLITALKDQDEDIRKAAEEALKNICSKESIHHLINALKDHHWYVRLAATSALGRIGNTECIQLLTAALNDQNYDVRYSAADELGQIGSTESIQHLIVALNDQDWNMRRTAAEALGRIGRVESIQPLISVLSDQHRDVRRAAVEALGRIGNAESIQPLISTMTKHKDWDMCQAVANALGRINSVKSIQPLIAALKDQDPDVRRAAAEGLGNMGHIGGEESVHSLVKSLKDQDHRVRFTAAYALGHIGSPEPALSLIVALKDKDADVRANAAKALGRIGSAESIHPLINALKDQIWYVRQGAAEALGHIRNAESIHPLMSSLNDQDSDVRHTTAKALGTIGSTESIHLLIDALKDQYPEVRRAGAYALAFINNAESIHPLIATLEDNNSDVRSAAAYALGRIENNTLLIQPLIISLRDYNSDVRSAAAYALGRIGDSELIHPLTDALNDQDMDVRSAVIEALGKIQEFNNFSVIRNIFNIEHVFSLKLASCFSSRFIKIRR